MNAGGGLDLPLRVSARAHYAVQAAAYLAAADGRLVKGEEIARSQRIPPKFLVQIMASLRRGRVVWSYRGMDGGYRLARPPEEITVADVIEAVEGLVTTIHGAPPREASYPEGGDIVRELWLTVEESIASVLTSVSMADLASGVLPSPFAVDGSSETLS